jgi:hypothetical protein
MRMARMIVMTHEVALQANHSANDCIAWSLYLPPMIIESGRGN